ncbi:hypothetical protein [Rhodoferax sp. BLA1]|uniref:hypothetical protein n=1 Tax=Rhodoferax sp. BLA1 TaxID=2576062 RepID=UPI0015D39052|nr:hypothetical protein [Rhodoferax sp. BLA1]
MTTEKQLDQLLEAHLRDDESFRFWFLSKTQKGSSYTRLVLLRSNHPWGKVRTILPNQNTGALEAVVREAETDVLAVLENPGGRRLALHIENKLAGGKFTRYQPEMYAARAEAWRKNEQYENYDDWETVLIAPRSFLARNGDDARKFMSFIAHEDIAAHVPEFVAVGDTC